MNTIPLNTPVIVGVGIENQKLPDPTAAKNASELMTDALHKAAADAGTDQLIKECDYIMVPQGMWAYQDPGKILAQATGATKAKTLFAQIGILQQTLLGEAAQRISQGTADIVVVAGGEARYRQLMADINLIEVSDCVQTSQPDEVLTPDEEMWLEAESNAGLAMPVGFYALLEVAKRYKSGMSVEKHRDYLGNLYSRFSEIACDNPYAWKPERIDADAIRNASEKNKMLAFPYTKLHNTSWNVDQASALIYCSVEKALELEIPREKWIFPRCSVESNHMINVSQRQDLAHSTGAAQAGARCLELAKLDISEIDYLDLYSCFPIAVQAYADALGAPSTKDYTFTGGMPFAGGPLNNYVLQSTCLLVELLRKKPGSHGLVSSVSGLMTKQGFGIFSTEPCEDGFQRDDVTAAVAKLEPGIEIIESYSGTATIIAYTVLYQNGEPWRLVAICDTDDGKRAIAVSEDDHLKAIAMKDELCGKIASIKENALISFE
ncbi:MAG: hypothetical protein AB8C02_18475 [Halioglobus sp.]